MLHHQQLIDLILSTATSATYSILGFINNSWSVIATQTVSSNGNYVKEFQSAATQIKFQILHNGTLYIDNFKLEKKATTLIDLATFESPAAVNTPSVNNWRFDPKTTYAWIENGVLNAKGGTLTYRFTSSISANRLCSLAVNTSGVSVNVKVTSSFSGGSSTVQQHTFTSNGVFNFTQYFNAQNTTIVITPGNTTSQYSIDNFITSTADYFNVATIVPAAIAGWDINSQNSLLLPYNYTSNNVVTNVGLQPSGPLRKKFKVTSGVLHEFSLRDITTSTGGIRARVAASEDEEISNFISLDEDLINAPAALVTTYNYKVIIYSLSNGVETIISTTDFN